MEFVLPRCCCPGPAARPCRLGPLGRQARSTALGVAAPNKENMPSLQEAAPASANGSVAGLNTYSRVITQQKSQGGSQAMLYATGLSDEDMHKPQVICIPILHLQVEIRAELLILRWPSCGPPSSMDAALNLTARQRIACSDTVSRKGMLPSVPCRICVCQICMPWPELGFSCPSSGENCCLSQYLR